MAQGEEFDRGTVRAVEGYRVETDRNGNGREDSGRYDSRPIESVREPLPRAMGSPLPMGSSPRSQAAAREGQPGRTNAAPPGRALSVPANSEAEASGMQWLMGVMKQAVPFVQKLLPMLEGPIAGVVASTLTARPHTPPPPPLDLQPIESSLHELHISQANLKDQLADQNTSLKRVEDQLDQVREATDRNTLEQQELIEDLKSMGNRVNLLAVLFLGLLVISVLLNIFLFLHIQRVLP